MRNPSTSKLVQVMASDAFYRRWIVWLPLLITSVIVFGGYSKDVMGIQWVAGLAAIARANISSINVWARKSSFPEATQLIFLLAWLFSFYYAFLVARWKPYREMYVGSLTGRRRHLKALPGLMMICIGLFFLNVTVLEAPSCRRMCIYKSEFIQVFYSNGVSFLLGYGFALIYWYLANFSKIYRCGGEKNE
ncbi:hypothetical protein D3C85_863340 [compost metagenome]|jgi:hypothetical protein|uniref:hypothetical protein n=1 Tax=Pseudomonas sp. PDM30 TaxID=2854773 RepID=UPI000FA87665|nr:hypothetical protein [Pseudomonas sp. PDM30]MBV7490514.1 hypothetical protein [Pseudomonas sp. PDM30]